MKTKLYIIVSLLSWVFSSNAQVVGTNDVSFNPGTGANSGIISVAVQNDGKIVAGGGFTTFNAVSKNRIVRLDSDGTLDPTFVSGTAADNTVYSVGILSSGKILACGQFTTYAGGAAKRVVRLNTNGTRDAGFNSGVGANNYIYSFVEQPDGKIIIVGGFTLYGGTSRYRVARVNTNGSLDASFTPGSGTNNNINAVALQSDGKVLIGGVFTTFNGGSRVRLARLNSNGTIDASFITGTGVVGTGTTTAVHSIVVQPDGKILVGGFFTTYNGTSKNNLIRLNSNGTLDPTFTSGLGPNGGYVKQLTLQSDGKIIAVGAFTSYNGTSKLRIVRLNSNGTIDNTFAGTGADNIVLCGALQQDGKLMIGGNFNSYSGDSRTTIARVYATCPTLTASVTGQTNSLCNGGSTGSATVSANGGSVFTYTWLPSGGNSSVGTNLSAGNYTCVVENECSNTSTVNVTITEPTDMTLTAKPSSTICNGSSTTLSVTATGGSGSYTYNWIPGNFTTSTQTVSPVTTTVYTVTVTDMNGCSKSTTQLVTVSGVCATSSVPCGITITNMNSTSSATSITGAVNYRFKFYNNITNALIATKIQASRTCTFNTVGGLYYGNTYKWTVAVDRGTGFGPESNNSCTVTFAAPKTTVPCGVSYSNLSSYTTCQFISAAKNYRFSFYNNTTNALMAVKTQTSNYIYFNTVPGLAYGNTYKWAVEVEYDNGATLLYGPTSNTVCTITFNPPKTTVPCGNTYAKNAYTSVPFVSGANAFRYNFYDATTSALIATTTNTTQYIYFNQVPGLIFNKAYKWTVEIRYHNGSGYVFGPASSNTCTMNYGTPSPIIIGDDSNNEVSRFSQNSMDDASSSSNINVFPNPTSGKIFIESVEPIKEVSVYNISGQLILKEENSGEINLADLKTGLYMISIRTESKTIHTKIIKE